MRGGGMGGVALEGARGLGERRGVCVEALGRRGLRGCLESRRPLRRLLSCPLRPLGPSSVAVGGVKFAVDASSRGGRRRGAADPPPSGCVCASQGRVSCRCRIALRGKALRLHRRLLQRPHRRASPRSHRGNDVRRPGERGRLPDGLRGLGEGARRRPLRCVSLAASLAVGADGDRGLGAPRAARLVGLGSRRPAPLGTPDRRRLAVGGFGAPRAPLGEPGVERGRASVPAAVAGQTGRPPGPAGGWRRRLGEGRRRIRGVRVKRKLRGATERARARATASMAPRSAKGLQRNREERGKHTQRREKTP